MIALADGIVKRDVAELITELAGVDGGLAALRLGCPGLAPTVQLACMPSLIGFTGFSAAMTGRRVWVVQMLEALGRGFGASYLRNFPSQINH